jgi:predicted nuclease with RNAse H fold
VRSTRQRAEARLTIALTVDDAPPTLPEGRHWRNRHATTRSRRRVGKRLRILPLLTVFSRMSFSDENYIMFRLQFQLFLTN